MTPKFISVLVFVLYFASSTLALTVDEAYKSIPHKRMEYSAEKSTLSSSTKADLEKLFKFSDEALVGRIETMKGLQAKHAESFAQYQKKTDRILNGLTALTSPESIQLATLLSSAITSQREFFSKWHDAVVSNSSFHYPGQDSSVQQASSHLRQLYSVLMQRYPNEHPDNIDAFYQHLCALDFL